MLVFKLLLMLAPVLIVILLVTAQSRAAALLPLHQNRFVYHEMKQVCLCPAHCPWWRWVGSCSSRAPRDSDVAEWTAFQL